MKRWELNKITKLMCYWLKQQKIFYEYDIVSRFYDEEKYEESEEEVYQDKYEELVNNVISVYIGSNQLLKRDIKIDEYDTIRLHLLDYFINNDILEKANE